MTPLPHPAPRPRLGFRAGITGARPDRLDPALVPALRAAVGAVLRAVRSTIAQVATEPALSAAFSSEAVALRFLSPLAEGSDRIAAEAALEEGFALTVPMPFARCRYETTFAPDPPAGFPPFAPLLDRAVTESGDAAVIVLDGSLEEDAEAGYRAVGRFVVRNVDLLIAVWDGRDGRPGGTAEIARYAAHMHVPLWWIDSGARGPPKLLVGPGAFADRENAPAGDAALRELSQLLRAALSPPAPGEPLRHGWLGEVMHRLALLFGDRREPLPAFFAEREEPERPPVWRLYHWLLTRIAPSPPDSFRGPGEPAGLPGDGVESGWQAIYQAADRHGAKYADRYRSSYVLIILLAAVTVAALGLGLALPHPARNAWSAVRAGALALTVLELFALAGIAVVVGAGELRRWHERWIAYRLLAELCRKERVLARLGWPLRVSGIVSLPDHQQPGHAPRDSWVGWYVAAMERTEPLPLGPIARHLPRARALAEAMIAGQTDYHRHRGHQSRSAARRLAVATDAAFGLTILLVIAKLLLLWLAGDGISASWLGMLAVALVALSAAAANLRSYAEFGLLDLQSERMLRLFREAQEELDALDQERALASVALGALLQGLALAMLEDVAGWSLLFRTKAPEAG